jgi:hypothetical protein
MLVMRPEAAQRVTVFGSTRNSAATSPGVSKRSLLPSTFSSDCPLKPRLGPSSLALNEYFLPRFLEIGQRFADSRAIIGSWFMTFSNNAPVRGGRSRLWG